MALVVRAGALRPSALITNAGCEGSNPVRNSQLSIQDTDFRAGCPEFSPDTLVCSPGKGSFKNVKRFTDIITDG